VLYQARGSRPAPLRDDKVLTACNGLMISAFARAAMAFSDDGYRDVAARAADFLLTNLRGADGRLMRSHLDGRSRHNAYLDDYAFFTAALIDTYEATGESRYLTEATTLARLLDDHHLDPAGGWYTTSDDHEELLVRDKPSRDGALPSGNSVAIANALRLAEFTGDHDHREVAERALSAFAEPMQRYGAGVPLTLSALDFHLDVPREIVIVDGPGGADLARVVGESFVPNRVLMRVTEAQALAQVGLIPLLEGKVALEGAATAYVCERGRCELPTSDPNVLRRQLSQVQPLIPGGSPEPLTVRR
ncbi:MAG: thioredoxin domain-containing protein, partial [Deltaproteobacteria bacterium]|nr:thioredoxin domain-containing protein [Deltaproteobacteria bacterium]